MKSHTFFLQLHYFSPVQVLCQTRQTYSTFKIFLESRDLGSSNFGGHVLHAKNLSFSFCLELADVYKFLECGSHLICPSPNVSV